MFSIAYRMVGTASDAEDPGPGGVPAVSPRDGERERWIERITKAYLSAVTTRLAIDHLRSARVRREQYVGDLAARAGPHGPRTRTLTQHMDTADSLSMAFLVLLESLLSGRAGGVPAPGGLRLRLRGDRRRGQGRARTTAARSPSGRAGRSMRSGRASRPRGSAGEELAQRFFEAVAGGDIKGLEEDALGGRGRVRRRWRSGSLRRSRARSTGARGSRGYSCGSVSGGPGWAPSGCGWRRSTDSPERCSSVEMGGPCTASFPSTSPRDSSRPSAPSAIPRSFVTWGPRAGRRWPVDR